MKVFSLTLVALFGIAGLCEAACSGSGKGLLGKVRERHQSRVASRQANRAARQGTTTTVIMVAPTTPTSKKKAGW